MIDFPKPEPRLGAEKSYSSLCGNSSFASYTTAKAAHRLRALRHLRVNTASSNTPPRLHLLRVYPGIQSRKGPLGIFEENWSRYKDRLLAATGKLPSELSGKITPCPQLPPQTPLTLGAIFGCAFQLTQETKFKNTDQALEGLEFPF